MAVGVGEAFHKLHIDFEEALNRTKYFKILEPGGSL